MGWFSRKKKEKEEIKEKPTEGLEAPSPTLPKIPAPPSIPRLEARPGMQAIKKEIRPATVSPTLPSQPPTQKPNIPAPPSPMTPAFKETKPIFVKIDKFKSAIEDFEEVKEKVDDIEKMLKEIREIRVKEDSELGEWEQEVRLIKSRIENIDNSLFKKIEK